MKRTIALLLCLSVFVFLAGCGQSQEKDGAAQETSDILPVTPAPMFGADLTGGGGGRIFARTAVSLPEAGLYVQLAVKRSENKVVVCCQDSAGGSRFFSIDISTLSVEPLDIAVEGEIVDMDSMGDGSLTLLTVDESGTYTIYSIDSDSSAKQIVLTEFSGNEDIYFWSICQCGNGYLLNSGNSAIAVDVSGSQIRSFGPYKGGIDFARTQDSGILILFTPTTEAGTTVQRLNESFDVTDTYELKNSYTRFYDCGSDGLFAYSTGIIYRLDYENDQRTGFCNTQASGGGHVNFIFLNEDLFFAAQSGLPYLWAPSDTDEITILRLATYDMSADLRAAVNSFNESNGKYMIDVSDYAIYDEAGNTELGLTRLGTDIISGDTPDIYDLERLPARMLANRGLFEDLRPFLDSDARISYTDIIPSVAKAMEDGNGRMCYLVPSFNIRTMYGNGDIVGSYAHLTTKDFLTLADSYSAAKLLGGMTGDNFLKNILIYNSGQYIDYETGVCDFDNAEFVNLLEFSKELYDTAVPLDSSDTARGYMGEQFLVADSFSQLVDSIAIADAVFHRQAAYVGFPTDDGNGVRMIPVIRLAMAASAMSKEGVWEFFSYLLGDEFQNLVRDRNGVPVEGGWIMQGVPAIAEHFEERLDLWIKTAQERPVALTDVYDGAVITIQTEPADESTRETAVSLVNRIDGVAELDSNIYEIVTDAAAAFYNGDKTAEETARLIQSRSSIYMAEQYS